MPTRPDFGPEKLFQFLNQFDVAELKKIQVLIEQYFLENAQRREEKEHQDA